MVNTTDKADVKQIFGSITVTSTTGAPVAVEQAGKVIINLADGTKNSLTDGATYTLASGTDEPNAALFSNADLTFYGGSATGTATDGVYLNPTYTPGTKNSSFTVASVVTKVNSR